jgi:hypothetical protein
VWHITSLRKQAGPHDVGALTGVALYHKHMRKRKQEAQEAGRTISARWLGSPSTTNSIHESADPPPVLPLPLYSCKSSSMCHLESCDVSSCQHPADEGVFLLRTV